MASEEKAATPYSPARAGGGMPRNAVACSGPSRNPAFCGIFLKIFWGQEFVDISTLVVVLSDALALTLVVIMVLSLIAMH